MSKEYKRWSKSETTPDKTKTVKVEEIDNGFIVEFCIDGKNEKTGEWEYKTKRRYSQTNPLADLDPEVTEESTEEFFNPPIHEY